MATIQVAILVSIFIGFFLLVWGLTYAFHNSTVRVASWLVWGTSGILFGGSAFYAVVDALYYDQSHALGQNLEGMSNTLGGFAFLWGLAAVFIFVSKRLFRGLHNAATSHGVYFLFHTPHSWSEFYSGVGAWIALALLAMSGMWMGNVANAPNRARVMRISHVALTVGYAGAIILHIRASLLIAGLLFTAAFLAMGFMWVLMRLAQSLSRSDRKT